ncbi:DEAD/DEAH box helicase family protein (plasmid) [Halarchaeum sp. CBA1220]|uniref:DEAD/DEAH box helicase n=1 Tax=Halarchaeum sp. CBA1220 TaxID=1853682 RepID=UPI000F3A90AB|nr:helicase-related protein [Halarchaeum sp. CBA1220]QLC35678.1 DEAD/DEAH box helicase family protein [Halarchaeum sp. CBA1220]
MSDCECGFDIGDRVSFAGGEGELVKANHRPSGQCLLHILTDDDQSKKLPAAVVDLIDSSDTLLQKGEFDDPDRFNLRAKAAELDLAHRQDRFVALENNRIDIAPHQVKAAHQILTSYDHRYLIADEVGLGKTIEAAIVIEELAARGQADRVLIVAPAPLTTQWQEELREKFDTNYVIYDRDYVEAKKDAYPAENVWSHENRIITSIDFAKQEDMRSALKNVQEDWDIALFDESHHLTARREGKRGVDKTDRYRVGEAVSETSDGLLFLTGTPHNGKRDQFYFMISLLDPYRFRDEHDVDKEGLRDLMIRRLKDEMYEADGSPMFPEKNIQTLPVEFTPEERQLYDDVTEYITEYYNLASREENDAAGFAMVLYQKRLVSSIYAIQQSLKNRMESIKAGGADPSDLSPITKSLLDEYREDPEMLTEAQREHVETELGGAVVSSDPDKIEEELAIVRDLYNQAKAIPVDSKAERLREYVDGILEEDPDEKILIFTEYTDTLEYLKGRVFGDRDIAEIYGDLSQSQRQQQFKKFEGPANVMLATDAAREGLNLQFAHIMVNYDLPWNPTRIDQRIGRLHRYGQQETVEIRNLFFKDTRESIILERLLEKIDEIEETLGMSSDVLGLVLDDVDLEDQIMSALATGQSPDAVVDDLEAIVEDQEEAVRRVDDELLIRDKFDLSEEDKEILDIVEESGADTVSDEDVAYLVKTVCQEFGGGLRNVRPGPAEDGGDVFDLVVPSQLTGDDIESRYDSATFDRENALVDETLEFITLDHPVVHSMMAYCLDTDAVGGQTAILTGGKQLETPGLFCNYRIGYLSGTGDTVTEKLVQVYVTPDGTTKTENIDITGGLPASAVGDHPSIDTVAGQAEELVSEADDVAQELINDLAQEAREDREREVRIRREHTENYFEYRMEDLEERIQQFEERDRSGEDMSAVLAKHRSQLAELREKKNTEMVRLKSEKQVVPDEPDLINMAVVIDAFEN